MMDKTKYHCVLVFVKAPETGKVKTRLSASLDTTIVLELYKNFVADIISAVRNSGYCFKICYYPDDSQKTVTEWLGSGNEFMPQHGRNIGERMANAFYDVFSDGCTTSILIGTDIPGISSAAVTEAFDCLRENNAVIGPAFDGGYYLIGFNSFAFNPVFFKGINWGTEHVFDQTRKIFEKRGIRFHTLEKRRDIDTLEDLQNFMEDARQNNGCEAKNTLSCLSKTGIIHNL